MNLRKNKRLLFDQLDSHERNVTKLIINFNIYISLNIRQYSCESLSTAKHRVITTSSEFSVSVFLIMKFNCFIEELESKMIMNIDVQKRASLQQIIDNIDNSHIEIIKRQIKSRYYE